MPIGLSLGIAPNAFKQPTKAQKASFFLLSEGSIKLLRMKSWSSQRYFFRKSARHAAQRLFSSAHSVILLWSTKANSLSKMGTKAIPLQLSDIVGLPFLKVSTIIPLDHSSGYVTSMKRNLKQSLMNETDPSDSTFRVLHLKSYHAFCGNAQEAAIGLRSTVVSAVS